MLIILWWCIKQDFHSVTWVIFKGWDLGMLGCQKFSFSEHGHVAYQIEEDNNSLTLLAMEEVNIIFFNE